MGTILLNSSEGEVGEIDTTLQLLEGREFLFADRLFLKSIIITIIIIVIISIISIIIIFFLRRGCGEVAVLMMCCNNKKISLKKSDPGLRGRRICVCVCVRILLYSVFLFFNFIGFE